MVLHETLERYPGAVVFGEDVAQKGGVYNVTEGLFKKFGPRRIFNSPLDEQTILGTAIGFARTASCQFLRFSSSPTCTMPKIKFAVRPRHWRSSHKASSPMAWSFESRAFPIKKVLAVISTTTIRSRSFANSRSDHSGAVQWREMRCKMLAHLHARRPGSAAAVVVFVEPIALYMTRDLHEADDKAWTIYLIRKRRQN